MTSTLPILKACSQVNNGNWCQETYESSSRQAGKRVKQLKALGYLAASSPMGMQVTKYGLVRLTLVDIRKGSNPDTFYLPPVEILD